MCKLNRVTAASIDELYVKFTADRDGMAGQFWPAVSAYASWCCFSVPEWLREDLVSDIVVAAMTRIDAIKLKVSFAKWLNGMICNMRAERFRTEKYQCQETPFSQLAIADEEGKFTDYEPSDAANPSDATDLITPEARAKAATNKLDELRISFKKPEDLVLFDLLRGGATLTDAADQMGQSYAAVQRRFARWKNKAGQTVSDVRQSRYVTDRAA